MTLTEADTVLNEDTMLAWYAGAARMDSGLTIAEQLATIAEEHDTDNGRDLIVCIMTSSLPIQNTAFNNLSTIRTAAVLVASDQLKNENATIFAFGDYHNSGKTMAGDVQDTEENFTSIMQQVCSEAAYFYSFSAYGSVTEALNAMMTQIVLVAADDAEQEQTVQTQAFASDSSDDAITWQAILDYYGASAQSVIASTMAQVAYYYFTGYDADGNPTFADEPYITLSVPLSDLVSADGIAYDATLIPLPNLDSQTSSIYGNKVSITIASPVTVTYQWASSAEGYVPSDVTRPSQEVVVLGTAHTPVLLGETQDVHYSFAGWYTDAACTTEYTGTNAITGSMTLYGKWDKYVLVAYYWNSWDGDYTTPDSENKIASGQTPGDFTPEGPEGYTFDGWYWDKDRTQPYEPGALTEDIALYAKWLVPLDADAATSVTLEATKVLTGSRAKTIADGEFTFTVTEDGVEKATGSTQAGSGSDPTASPEEAEETESDQRAAIAFTAITYSPKDIGRHFYTIQEVKGEDETIAYADQTIQAVVDVYDKGDGTLVTYSQTADAQEGSFVNAYQASGTLSLTGTKVVTNRTREVEEDEFSFTITEVDGTFQATAKTQTGGGFAFPDLVFDQRDIGSTHTYVIEENQGDDPYVSYTDEVITVTVAVRDSEESDGTLDLDVTYTDSSGKEVKQIRFVNGYAYIPQVGVRLDVVPYVVIVALALGVGTLKLLHKRRRPKKT
jgi:pilin isopeptide linkage protein/uncharacterized repeat protein (TIGR02543 family)